MASLLKLRQAARLIGVSPGRLYRAIADGRLIASRGGGPGKPTLVSLEALQAFCRREGLEVPETSETRERSGRLAPAEQINISGDAQQTIESLAGQMLAQVIERQSTYFEAFLRTELDHLVNRILERLVDQVTDRVTERLTAELHPSGERPERSARSERSLKAIPDPKTAVQHRLRAMQAEGLSLQAIADQLNAEGVPTLSGKGRWRRSTVGNLLGQGNETP